MRNPAFKNLGVTIKRGTASVKVDTIVSWSDTRIGVKSSRAAVKDIVTVSALYGNDSAAITK